MAAPTNLLPDTGHRLRHDVGVAFTHAEDFAATISGAQLVELDSPTHLFWIGPQARHAQHAVHNFFTTTA